jgi:zinc protease
LSIEKIGPVARTRLNNGLTVLVRENHNAPVVAIQIWIDAGSADEKDSQRGLAHFHEHMLFKGTKRRAVGEIAKAIEGAGGDINAWTSFDHTVYHVVLASRFFDLGLEVLVDAVTNPVFDAQEIEREKKVVLEEIKQTLDSPERWISDLLFSNVYQVHPYRYPILGTEKSVSAFTRKKLKTFFSQHYVPGNMTLLVSGDIKTKNVLRKLGKLFPGKKTTAQKAKAKPKPIEPDQRKARLKIVRDDVQEAHFTLGWHIPALADSDVPALDVLALVLGQGESSRLNLRIRQGKNLVNDIYAYTYTPQDPGVFVIGGSCKAGQTARALKQIATEISKFSSTLVDKDELSKAKTMLESEALYSQETVEGITRRLGYNQVLMGDPNYGNTYLSRVIAVTLEDVKRVAAKYLTHQNLTAIVILPDKQAKGLSVAKLQKNLQQGLAARKPDSTQPAKDIVRVKIKNGPVVIIQEDHTNQLVSFRAVYLGGVRYENRANNGINNYLASMITKGTKTRTAQEIATQTDALAGFMEGFSGRNTFGMRADFPSKNLDQALKLFCDCLLRPTFDDNELKRERELILQEIQSREDNLAGLAFDLFYKTLFKSHPYGLPSAGTRQSIVSLTKQDLKKYYNRHFSPDQLVLSIVGDLNPEQVIKQIRGQFRSIALKTQKRPPTIPLEPRPKNIRVSAKTRSRAQAHVVLGFMGSTLSSKDRYSLEILMAVLAGQGGRLFVELRDQLSLAYSVSGLSLEGIEPGYIAVYIACDPKRVTEAVAQIKKQLQRISKDLITAKELSRAKRYLIGIQAISLQRASARAASLAFNELYGLGYLSYRDYPDRVQSVSREDVRRVARKFLTLDAYSLAIVQPDAP